MKNVLVILIVLIGIVTSNAQKSNAVYTEILGQGLIYSMNYEHRFGSANKLGARIGGGYFKGSDPIIMVPAHLNYLFGNKHALEIGAGITANIAPKRNPNLLIAPSSAVMYRYTGDSGFLFRVGITSTYLNYDPSKASHVPIYLFYFWPGMSLGYAF